MRAHPLLFAYLGALVPAMLMAFVQPVWSRVDEAQHTDFIVQLSHGVYPVADRTVIDEKTLRLIESTGVYRFEAPGSYPTPDPTDIAPPPAGMSARANAVWMSRHLWQLSYESAQTPGYYVLMVPFWIAADASLGTEGAVYTMRVINALLIALLAPMAVVLALRVAPDRPQVAAISAVFAILLPGLALDMTRTGNDALGAVLGGLVVLLAATWAGGGWTVRRALTLGVVLGAAALVKLTVIAMAPAVAVALLWPSRQTALSRRVALLVLAGAITALCLAIWFAINLHLYGVPVPSARTNRLSIVPPMAFDLRYIPFDLAFYAASYWSGEPLGALPFASGFAVMGVLVTLIAGVGLVLRRSWSGAVVASLAGIAGMLAFALLLPATAAFQFAGPGRYEYPALPAVAALTAVGVTAALARDFAARTLVGMYAVFAVVVLGVGAVSLASASPGGGPGVPPESASLTPVSAAGRLGDFEIRVDQVALDGAGQATWIHVTAVNGGGDEAEWSPVAVVSAGGATAAADYSRSTRIPGDLDPGQSVGGWLLVPVAAHPGETLHIVFPGVALDGYSTVADVAMDVAV